MCCTWVKFCDKVDNWAGKAGKEKMAERCKCFNAQKNGEVLSEACKNLLEKTAKKKQKKLST